MCFRWRNFLMTSAETTETSPKPLCCMFPLRICTHIIFTSNELWKIFFNIRIHCSVVSCLGKFFYRPFFLSLYNHVLFPTKAEQNIVKSNLQLDSFSYCDEFTWNLNLTIIHLSFLIKTKKNVEKKLVCFYYSLLSAWPNVSWCLFNKSQMQSARKKFPCVCAIYRHVWCFKNERFREDTFEWRLVLLYWYLNFIKENCSNS